MFSRLTPHLARQTTFGLKSSQSNMPGITRRYGIIARVTPGTPKGTPWGWVIGGAIFASGLMYWQQNGESLMKKPPPPAINTLQGNDEWVDLKLLKVEPYNHNTQKFTFQLPSRDHVSGLTIASAVLTKFQGPDDKKPTIRPYTPITDDDQRGYMDLLVKKYPKGPMSSHIHKMEIGDTLSFKGPLPKYQWEENMHEKIVLIAGGTGITPMWQIMRHILKNFYNDKTRITLIYANVMEEDILMRKELGVFENTFPQRFKSFYVLEKPPRQNWVGETGYITKELLQQVMPEPKEEPHIFVCGPPGMMKAISGEKKSPRDQGPLSGYLKELGYTSEQVYKF